VPKLIRDELLLTRDVADHRHVAWLFGHSVFEPGPSEMRAGAETIPPADAAPIGPRD
jgi:hypothetical protein